MFVRRLAIVVAALLCVAACQQPPSEPVPAPVDLEAERAALRQADEAWSAAASAMPVDVDRVVDGWTDDARIYPPGMPVIEGKEAIRGFVEESLKVPGFAISWQPEEVTVSPDGQWGYTTGTNAISAPGPDGAIVTTEGRYVTVWRKDADGTWRCTIDIWNAGPAA